MTLHQSKIIAMNLQDFTNRLNTESTRFGMENSAEKSKTFVVGKTPETIRPPVKLSGKQLEQVKQFYYLGCSMPDSGRSANEDTSSNCYVVTS